MNTAGEKLQARIFFGADGAYTFFCAVPGHEAAGMKGIVTVTGPPMTLQAGRSLGDERARPPRPAPRLTPVTARAR